MALGTRYTEERLAPVEGYQVEDPTNRLIAELRVPRAPRPDIDKLPAALEQPAAAW